MWRVLFVLTPSLLKSETGASIRLQVGIISSTLINGVGVRPILFSRRDIYIWLHNMPSKCTRKFLGVLDKYLKPREKSSRLLPAILNGRYVTYIHTYGGACSKVNTPPPQIKKKFARCGRWVSTRFPCRSIFHFPKSLVSSSVR
jgi:hypothetical protein